MLFIRMFGAAKRGDSEYARIIFENGLAYFTIVTILCVTNFLLFVILPDSKQLVPSALTLLMESVASVLSCRLILRLREHGKRDVVVNDLMSMSVNVFNVTQLHPMEFEENRSVGEDLARSSPGELKSLDNDSEVLRESKTSLA
ncbi:hypothetical protein SCHPADRAFT_387584 [Schizopora paradoxa]|uniref:Uncharacterized protein n=1 Tax=Schizopora paradoxa TaxID=27342 RepID=A0A0H2RU65_9AGAM|nr:hypothetical protein SCHPADRAFT_387584 [Schizopora paradoxa]